MCFNHFFKPHRSSCQQLHMLLEFLKQREEASDDKFSTINNFQKKNIN